MIVSVNMDNLDVWYVWLGENQSDDIFVSTTFVPYILTLIHSYYMN
jgi:hypothetical protein